MTAPALQLSILDQSPIAEGSSGAAALRNSIDLARLAESLGYARYWVAEHHGSPMLAGASPEALIGPIASVTSRMRVGSGGVMLPHYSPLKVAETFSILSALFPDRIDLGIGRAAGTDPTTTFALQRDRRHRAPDDFPQQLAELLGYLWDRMPPDDLFAPLAALPGRPESPSVSLLGSSPQSGIWAAQLGLPYVFADFISPTGAAIAERYRADFHASERLRTPRVTVAVSAICAETDDEAQRLASSMRMAWSLVHRGHFIPVPPVDKAMAFLAEQARDSAPRPGVLPRARRAVVGSPSTVQRELERVAHEYGAEEVMIVTIVHEHDARRRSYELIAREFAIDARA
jgi:luciferase family oxidoreductase group 1